MPVRESTWNNNVLKIKTVLTRNNIIKYWELSIDMCQSSSANDIIFLLLIGIGNSKSNSEETYLLKTIFLKSCF